MLGKKIFIFIHIPKTSGLWIKRRIDMSKKSNLIYYKTDSNFIDHHYTIFNIKDTIQENNKNRINFFTIVRNPYERIYSLWRYFKSLPIKNTNSIGTFYKIIPEMPEKFEDFVFNYCEGYYDAHLIFQSQIYFLKGEKHENIKILKYENRKEINDFLLENNVSLSDLKVNTNKEGDLNSYLDFYTDNLKEMLYNKLDNEFILFNYQK